jgi:hypothetical protein
MDGYLRRCKPLATRVTSCVSARCCPPARQAELLQVAAERETGAPASARGGAGDAASSEAPGPSEAERAAVMARLRSICSDLDGARREQMQRDVSRSRTGAPPHALSRPMNMRIDNAMMR